MRPIGPAALKALREKIRSGAYPSDDVVRDGIERLIRRAE
jgi:Arc/MetJ-type ribon-helix-helix transcriptional regulator